MPSYQTIALTTDPRGIARLDLARPEKHNSMDAQMLHELTHAAKQLHQDDAVRAVVLSGQGSSFCAGADLQWMRANLDLSRAQRIQESNKLTTLLQTFTTLSKFLIARVNGQAYAGGIGLIATCDLAIGTTQARFSLTETRLGLAPANIAPYVIARMGAQNARRTMLNAHTFYGEEAAALGLLDIAVDAAELDNAVDRELTELLNCDPSAIATTKKMLAHLAHEKMDAAQTSRYTSQLLADMWEQDAAKEGITAFFAKRKPNWAIGE